MVNKIDRDKQGQFQQAQIPTGSDRNWHGDLEI